METEETISLPLKSPNKEELAKVLNYKPNYWQAIVEKSNARFKVVVAGTRSGKSLWATYSPVDGIVADLGARNRKVWLVSSTYDLTARLWDNLKKICWKEPFKNLIKTFNNTKGFYKLETVLGTTIEAKSASDPARLVGIGLNRLVVDEAGQKEVEEAYRVNLRTRLIDYPDTKAVFIGTPSFGKSGLLWELYQKGQGDDPDWESWQFSTYDNKDPITGKLLLEGGLKEIEKLKKDLSEEDFQREIMAQFTEVGRKVFTNISKNFDGTEFREYDKDNVYLIGVDLGRVRNRTVIFVVNRMTNRIDYCEHFAKEDWKVVVSRIKTVCEKYGNPRGYFDATSSAGDIIGELLADEGVALEPYVFNDVSKREAINKLAYFVNSGKLKYPKNETIKPLFDEMQNYGKFESELSSRLLYKPISTKWGEDFITALALACWNLEDEPLKSKFDFPFTFPAQNY